MAGETYLVESSTTGDVAPCERADFWSEHVTSYQGRMSYRYLSADNFAGRTVRQYTDTFQLVKFWSENIVYTRSAGQVRQAPGGDYKFLLPLSGEMAVRQEGQESRLCPGTGGLFTFDSPFEVRHDSSTRAFIMTIPACEVEGPLNRSSPVGAGLELSSGLGRVARDMVTNLFEERDNLTDRQFDEVSNRLVELLCMLVVGDDRPDVPGHLTSVEAMVRRFVREHAADPGLTGAAVARALGWSLRQVQLTLQRAGTTPRDLIREERLQLVRDRLRDPSYRHMTVTDLAYSSGFSSASTLSTAFRRRFGMSPRDVRHSDTAGAASGDTHRTG